MVLFFVTALSCATILSVVIAVVASQLRQRSASDHAEVPNV